MLPPDTGTPRCGKSSNEERRGDDHHVANGLILSGILRDGDRREHDKPASLPQRANDKGVATTESINDPESDGCCHKVDGTYSWVSLKSEFATCEFSSNSPRMIWVMKLSSIPTLRKMVAPK